MPVQKIKSGRVLNPGVENFVGDKGQLFYDEDVGQLRLSDGTTPGGIVVGGGGGGQIEVSLIEGSTVTNRILNVTAIRFDTDSGFDITNLGGGSVKIGMNSTFKYWEVDGQETLVAQGLDTVKFVAGPGITLKTNISTDPKQLEISADDRITTLYQDGSLTLTTGTVRWYAPNTLSISKITTRLSESADDEITVQIKKNTNTASIITISTGSIKTVLTTTISMVVDDYLTVDVIKIGNTLPGSDLNIEFTYNLT